MKELQTNKMKWKLPEIPYQEQLLFIFVFSIVIYGAYSTTDSTSLNVKRGLLAIVIIYIGESMLKPYDILFLRPNMAFWRVVLKCVQLYYYVLIFLAYQKIEDGRSFFKFFDSSLGVPVPESMHTYDDHCEFQWSNILDNLDHYYMIHWFNFIMLELIYRDQIFCWFWSVFTEIIELSLQHILPHFAECWWDHIVLDILLSNLPGILIGFFSFFFKQNHKAPTFSNG